MKLYAYGKKRIPRKLTLIAAVIAGLSPVLFSADSENLRVGVAVSSQEVFVGESFQMQVQVSGSDAPEEPDLSGITDFSVETLGHQQNNSSFSTIINGKVSQRVSRGYIFNYRLTPLRAGSFSIPEITVTAGGKTVKTDPLTISVKKPQETNDFKLRMSLSKTSCYEGEPVILTVTWYIGKDVRGFNITLPVLEKTDAFQFADARNVRADYRIPLKGGDVAGQKGRGRLDGNEYTTLTFQKVLISKKSGSFEIEPATIVCETLTGYKKTRDPFGSSFGDDFFNDDFFSVRQGVYKNIAVPSNGLKLDVLDLPSEGQPANFAGHVGEYRVDTMAKPAEVNVGDPITLTVILSGPEYLENVNLPALDRDDTFTRDFKIPADRADGRIQGNAKVFTQTIRAKRSDVKEIPPVQLSYFDTKQGKYATAKSAPIPITVRATKIITANDAEGRDQTGIQGQTPEARTGGIAANYEDLSAIEDMQSGPETWLASPLWLSVIFVPPLAYFALLIGATFTARRRNNASLLRSRRACSILMKELSRIRGKNGRSEELLDALRKYLGDKFSIASGSLTFEDVAEKIKSGGVDSETAESLREVFTHCEAGRYAGGMSDIPVKELAEQIKKIATKMEKTLK